MYAPVAEMMLFPWTTAADWLVELTWMPHPPR
jgi:hypothetical protein